MRWTALLITTASLMLGIGSTADAYIYWSAKGGIGRANLDRTGVNESFIPSPAPEGPSAIAVGGSRIFWANDGYQHEDSIGSAGIDGSGVDQLLVPNSWVFNPAGLATDGSNLFWSAPTYNAIARTNASSGPGPAQGHDVHEIEIVQHIPPPGGVATDGSHVYWADPINGTIGRANLDGTGANPSFITGADGPREVAVDGKHVYWNNARTIAITIGRANLDGSGVNQQFIGGYVGGVWAVSAGEGLAVDDAHIYWSAKGGPGSTTTTRTSIGRANIDGTGVTPHWITGLSKGVGALAVDGLGPQPGPSPGPSSLALSITGNSRQVVRTSRSLRVVFVCTVDCKAKVLARLYIGGPAVAEWSGTFDSLAGKTHGITLNLKARTYRRVRAALKAGRRVRLGVAIRGTDPATGAQVTKTRYWTVRLG